jgi:Threonine dehydrogenase and related Zn-dependent dehydrogenases
MKRLIMDGPKKSSVVDVPDLVPGDNQVLIKVKYCGVCMSEHYSWSVAKKGDVFGHEPMGHVAAVGKNVTRFKIGDRVSGLGGAAFSEYTITNEKTTFHIPDSIPDVDATLEPLMCLLSAANKLAIPVIGDTVAVVGTGYMGLGAVSLLKQVKGAGRVVAVDLRPEARANALKYGADEVYAPDEIPEEYIADMAHISGRGFSVVAEWGETAESLDLAIKLTKMNGQLGIGAYHTGGNRSVDVQLLNVKSIDALSTHPRHTEDEFVTLGNNVIRLLDSGKWKFINLPHKIFKLNEFDLAHEEIHEKPGNYIKGLIDCTRW